MSVVMSFAFHLLLIDGYIGEIERQSSLQMPSSICKLIKTFYPLFKVYAIGRNDNGQFGLGHGQCRPLNKFKQLPKFSQLVTNVEDIYCNKGRFIIKTMNNGLYAAGTNILGQCGLSLERRRYTKFHKLKFAQNCTSDVVSCGTFNRHSFITTLSKNSSNPYMLFACGGNASAQFGNGCKTTEYQRSTWTLIKHNFTAPIRKIVCSDQHSLFLCTDGRLYSCGDNEYGTLGLAEHISETFVPTQIMKQQRIIDMDCGMWHNICVDALHKVWVFGANFFGQIGYYVTENMSEGYLCFNPRMNEFLKDKDIYRVLCGSTHSLCMALDGNVYLFGHSSLGQIGDGVARERNSTDGHGVFMPYSFHSNDKFKHVNIIDASCGANHNVLLSTGNKVITFGDNKYRQCSAVLFEKNIEIVTRPYVLLLKDIGMENNMVIEKVLAETNSTLVVVSAFKKC